MPDCNFVAQGKDDSEVMRKTAEHAKSAHRMVAISMEVERKARAAIRDDGSRGNRQKVPPGALPDRSCQGSSRFTDAPCGEEALRHFGLI